MPETSPSPPGRVPVPDAVAAVDPLAIHGGHEIHDGKRRAPAEAVEVLIGNDPGMAAEGVIGSAVDVQLVGGDGDHVVLAVERPAVVETVKPGVLRPRSSFSPRVARASSNSCSICHGTVR